MKKILISVILITLASMALYAADAKVINVTGKVEIKEPGGSWSPLSPGQVVSTKSMVSTGFGSSAKILVGGMELNLRPLTRVVIDSLNESGNKVSTNVSLRTGQVRATKPRAARTTERAIDFRVSTPVATAAVRGTDFNLSFNKIETYEGLVQFSQGQAVVYTPGGASTWAVVGERPKDPASLVSERWEVVPVAGSMVGENTVTDFLSDMSSGMTGSVQLDIF